MARVPNTGPTLKTRRSEMRRTAQRFRIPWQARLRAPAFAWGVLAWGAFTPGGEPDRDLDAGAAASSRSGA